MKKHRFLYQATWKRLGGKLFKARKLLTTAVIVAVLAVLQGGYGLLPNDHGLSIASRPNIKTTSDAKQDTAVKITVTSVHDGDTFRIGSERVRIIGIDAPEIGKGAQCAHEQKVAIEARNYLKDALGGSHVRIRRQGQDIYGRTLAHVHIAGQDIATVMIQKGLAKPYIRGRHGDWCH